MEGKCFAKLLAARIAASVTLAKALLWGDGPAVGSEIRLLSAAAMQSVFKEITADFERQSGHSFSLPTRPWALSLSGCRAARTADLVIGSMPPIATLVKEGKIEADGQFTICRVGAGVVVPSGTPKPQVSAVDDFKRVLFAA